MSNPDYTYFYKNKYATIDNLRSMTPYDLFISAYNDSERVRLVFHNINAKTKHWLILPEYKYVEKEIPKDHTCYLFEGVQNEAEIIVTYFNKIADISKLRICIDITGFMRPHIIFMLRYLLVKNIKLIDVIYTDPNAYSKKEKTTFTKSSVENVRQVFGCEGQHVPDTTNDILIIGSGYDYKLIACVAESKAHARKIQVIGFPSLQPDMYQENLINTYRAQESIGSKTKEMGHLLYAPANDPFVTARIIQEFVNFENSYKPITNLYLSPLATKAQTLGFALYFMWECLKKPISIIFPFCNEYSKETSIGIARIWRYTIHLP